jgi:acyl-CoA dehydrogenase
VIVYGQLILEQARLCQVEEDLIDVVFDALFRDLSAHAGEPLPRRHPGRSVTGPPVIRSPVIDLDRFERIWQ